MANLESRTSWARVVSATSILDVISSIEARVASSDLRALTRASLVGGSTKLRNGIGEGGLGEEESGQAVNSPE